ncbi:hypothetical protein PYW07_005937 [Mythimna separata]|uniref:Uncharacterized protein n=1 Tax=Mythimna separata TaxID=271217 RepID=A0AAD8DSE5_MYTSE|nr:hypothetical protein PYW07_005937 [Mythimna separata]
MPSVQPYLSELPKPPVSARVVLQPPTSTQSQRPAGNLEAALQLTKVTPNDPAVLYPQGSQALTMALTMAATTTAHPPTPHPAAPPPTPAQLKKKQTTNQNGSPNRDSSRDFRRDPRQHTVPEHQEALEDVEKAAADESAPKKFHDIFSTIEKTAKSGDLTPLSKNDGTWDPKLTPVLVLITPNP